MKAWLLTMAVVLGGDSFIQQAPPPPLYSVGGAWDVAGHRLVIFGGFGNGGYGGVTWTWDGTSWSALTREGPSPRNGPVLSYDTRRLRVVLFGGDTRDTGPLGDTWELDGSVWRQVAVDGPPRRGNHAMAYDPVRGRVVMFGGVGVDGATLADTWEWDGVRWTRIDGGGPAARFLHAMAWDPTRQRVVLFGGSAAPKPDAEVFGDTWEWDGRSWQRIVGGGPGPRDHVAMTFDPGRGGLVLEGGRPEERDSAWLLLAGRWTRLGFPAPGRSYPVLVTDPRTGAVLLYGGFEARPSNALFRLERDRWVPVAP